MPKTATKPKKPSKQPKEPVSTDGPIFTLTEAAAYLRVAETDLRRLAEDGDIPGRRVGPDWRFARAAIDAWLSVPEPKPKRGSIDAILKHAATIKDDGNVEEMLALLDSYRGPRPTQEDE